MEILAVKDLSFFYPDRSSAALNGVDFAVEKGQFVVIAGASGSGKSTLLRHFKTALEPYGRRSGKVLFRGRPLDEWGQREQSAEIGFVLQSPENQMVTDKVWHELAFGLESLGYETPVIRARVAETAAFFGIEEWFGKNVAELSGGQKQLLNLASIMAMRPELLILDEPTSRLDPIAAEGFVSALCKINRELGTTIIISEHRLDEVLPVCDCLYIMDSGKILFGGQPKEVGEKLKNSGHGMFMSMPVPMRVFAAVPNSLNCPLTVREGQDWLSEYALTHTLGEIPKKAFHTEESISSVKMDNVWFRYGREDADAVRGVSLKVQKGEFLAVLGGNGAGKSTTMSLIAGLNRPYRGKVHTNGKAVMLPQDPQVLFAKKTVYEELKEMKFASGINFDSRFEDTVRLCGLEKLLESHPYDLSGGEMQRAALAKILLADSEILLLDEPTKGMDAQFKAELAKILKSLTEKGKTIIMVSHDLEFCAENAHRCVFFFEGSIVSEGTPEEFFGGNTFYTTAAGRMARHLLPKAVTAADIISACGGKISDEQPERHMPESKKDIFANENLHIGKCSRNDAKKALPKRTVVSALTMLLAIPITVLCGVYFLDDRKYTFISLLVLLESMLPFFLIFEGRKPQARELVVIAVLCALGVAGRAAFFMIPEFKPVAAIVIISGLAFGGETGFLVGAMTMLASNVMFGQGPWTPWQMFSMGLIGFAAGAFFKKGFLPKARLPVSVFGAVCTLVIYGGIMNAANVLMYQENLTETMLLASYASGLPFDLIHSCATFFFLFLLTEPMLEKLDRVKLKYGLIV